MAGLGDLDLFGERNRWECLGVARQLDQAAPTAVGCYVPSAQKLREGRRLVFLRATVWLDLLSGNQRVKILESYKRNRV